MDSIWISPLEAIDRNDAGEFDLMRVTRIQLEMLAEQNSHAALIDWLHGLTDFPVFRPSVPAAPAGDQSRDQDPD